jgi:hypothetical protein
MLQLRRKPARSHMAAALALTLFTVSSFAGATATAAETPSLSLELNKVEASEHGCRIFMVADNQSETAFAALRLDLVFFQTDGVIGKRVALDLAPVKAQKRVVKAFDIDKVKCDGIGSILINEVAECRAEAGPLENCLARMNLKSLSTVQLTK